MGMNSFDPGPDVRSMEMFRDELRSSKIESKTSAEPTGLGWRSLANLALKTAQPEGRSGFQGRSDTLRL